MGSTSFKEKREEKDFKLQLEKAKNALNQTNGTIERDIIQNFISCSELSRKGDETEAIVEALKQKIEKKTNSKLQEQLEKYEDELSEIISEINKVQLDADKDLDDVEKWQYSSLCENFEKILSSKKIWLITSSFRNTELKSLAANTVDRKDVDFDTGVFNYIKSSFNIPVLRDLSDNTYYIYPRYIIKSKSFIDFEVFPIESVDFKFSKQRFIEEDTLLEDSYPVDYTYQYVNKNGGPDKRFSYNPRLPIVEYGKIEIEKLGLTYHISDYISADQFVNAYNLWRSKSSNDKIIPIQKQNNITIEYFNQVNEMAEKLVVFHNQLVNDKDFVALVKEHLHQRNGTVKDSDIIYLLFCIDLKKCYDKLQIRVDFRTKEGLGFLIFSKRALGLQETQYYHLDVLLDLGGDSHNQVLSLINTANLQGELQYHFLVADLLSVRDRDLMKQYIIMMYRLASIISKADGRISDVEQKWLSELMKINEMDEIVDQSEMPDFEEDLEFQNDFDTLFKESARVIVIHQQGSTSLIQRKFSIGYYRAGQIMDQLEDAGVVGSALGSKPRDVLVKDEFELEVLLKKIKYKSSKKQINKEKTKTERIYPIPTSNSQTELKTLIGLSSVKAEIETLSNFIKIQNERQLKGLKISQPSYHCVFTGNPGTGKTTVARIVAEIYKELGILKKGHLVETDRSGLVAEYVGQTAVKTNKIIDAALDGVLFIDEAYSLISDSQNDYGKEAIATLLKRMEDNRDRLVVILAGYTTEMKEFISTNSGLQSRFNRYIEFPDYSAEELYQIFEYNTKKFEYSISDTVIENLKFFFTNSVETKDNNFGNARFVRNFFEKTLERQANRLARETNLTTEKLTEIVVEDINVN